MYPTFTPPSITSTIKSKVQFSADGTQMFLHKKRDVYRQIPDHPDYYISRNGQVRNLHGKTLRNTATSNGSQLKLWVGDRAVGFYRHELTFSAWPELAPRQKSKYVWIVDGETYRVIREFPEYVINVYGDVLRIKNWQLSTPVRKQIHMSRDGKQHNRSCRKLVLATWGCDIQSR